VEVSRKCLSQEREKAVGKRLQTGRCVAGNGF
jgi:hypothetical protein